MQTEPTTRIDKLADKPVRVSRASAGAHNTTAENRTLCSGYRSAASVRTRRPNLSSKYCTNHKVIQGVHKVMGGLLSVMKLKTIKSYTNYAPFICYYCK